VKETYKTTELEGESGVGKKNPSTLFKREEDPAK
jgi:hypothetical protein